MGYKTTRHVTYDGKPYPAGKPITFADDDAGRTAREQLLALAPPAIEGGDAKPLEKMTKAERATVETDQD